MHTHRDTAKGGESILSLFLFLLLSHKDTAKRAQDVPACAAIPESRAMDGLRDRMDVPLQGSPVGGGWDLSQFHPFLPGPEQG